jgi:S1-C subfamily serine protease
MCFDWTEDLDLETINSEKLSCFFFAIFLFFFFFFFFSLKLHRCVAVSLPPLTKRSATNPIAKLERKPNELGAARGQHGHGRDKLARSKRKQKEKHHHRGNNSSNSNNNNNDVVDGDEDELVLNEADLPPEVLQQLQKFMLSGGADGADGSAESSSVGAAGAGRRAAPLGQRALRASVVDLAPETLALVDENWRIGIVRKHGGAVCKVISHLVAFDWEQPFKSADAATSVGTGWFIDVESVSKDESVRKRAAQSNGAFIVTNAHVIEGAVKLWITVQATGEQRFDATVCGVCFDIDLAVLYVHDKRLPATTRLKLGDSNAVEIGESVVALGHPLGSQTLKLTEGVISGRDAGLLSTTSPLNPGNSGGPLVNKHGDVIGVNVAIIENSQNIGFAIPSFQLGLLFDSLASRPADAKVLFKPVLGCAIINTSPALLAYSGITDDDGAGVFITEVLVGFPMHNAGLREGDIMVSFDGYPIDSYGACTVPWHADRAPLDTVVGLLTERSTPEVVYFREGKRQAVKLSFASEAHPGLPLMPAIRSVYPPFEAPDYEVVFGLVVMPLTLNHVELFHEDANAAVLRSLTPLITDPTLSNTPRVVISALLGGSDISRVDVLEPANIVSKLNGQPVATLAEFRAAFLQPVVREGRGLFMTLETSDHKIVALNVREALDAEAELADMYRFNVSVLIRRLLRREAVLQHAFGGDKAALQQTRAALLEDAGDGSTLSPPKSPRQHLSAPSKSPRLSKSPRRPSRGDDDKKDEV